MRRYWQTYSFDVEDVEIVLDYCNEQGIPYCVINQTQAYADISFYSSSEQADIIIAIAIKHN